VPEWRSSHTPYAPWKTYTHTCHQSGAEPGERIWKKSSSPWTATIGQTEPIAYRSPARVKPNRPADSICHSVSSNGAPKNR
jgi:hypothetical protein